VTSFDRRAVSDPMANPAIPDEAVLASRVRIAAWCLLTLAALIDTAYGRHGMNPDGVSYLDMGDATLRGDWNMAINAYWSPLYPWLQGLALRLFTPSAYSQFTVVHWANFLIFLFALGGFDFMLRAAVADCPRSGDVVHGSSLLPQWAVYGVGYSVFLWSTLGLITMERVSPDMLMAGFLYLAVGLLLRIWAQPRSFSRFALLGAVLGFGYLTKAAVFPLAFLFFAISWILAAHWRIAVPRVIIAVLVFLAVAGPWAMVLSRSKGRFTFGDSRTVLYVALVNGASPLWYFQTLGTATGNYQHTVRKIFDAPTIYEFASPIKGSLPVWYDPSYWAQGAVPRFSLGRQLAVVEHWLDLYFDMLFTTQAALLVGFIVLCFMAGRDTFLTQIARRWPLWLIGLVGLGIYAMLLVELRYVAVFFTLIWVGLFSGLAMPAGRDGRRLVAIVTLAVAIAIAGPTAISTAGRVTQAFRVRPHNHWLVAEGLRNMGVMPGDRVARIGGRFGTVYWARVLGVTVVAEIPLENAREYWYATPEVRAQVIETFRSRGVTAVVADMIPPDAVYVPGPEWRKLGDGTYYALKIEPSSVK
jgi:hypothetical protein